MYCVFHIISVAILVCKVHSSVYINIAQQPKLQMDHAIEHYTLGYNQLYLFCGA